MLELDGLVKQYRTGDQALTGVVSGSCPRVEVMALIGPSGAGKSTLDSLRESAGGADQRVSVLLDGRRPHRARIAGGLRRARRRMGMIFQEYALVERLTVMENVLSGRLGYVGFWRSYFASLSAEGRQRGVQTAGTGRSRRYGGQARRRALRRPAPAGRHRPRIDSEIRSLLLVDEPTASLDPKTSRQIMRLICELCRGKRQAGGNHQHPRRAARADVCASVSSDCSSAQMVYDGAPERLDR